MKMKSEKIIALVKGGFLLFFVLVYGWDAD